ncbi:NAD(P)H-dependent oxidoreductase subunit E [Kaistia dalseonensis]|uniref:(2Fe-2S) ferredoxin n=1 Tax=Kaistia dalseonensis TaxID=410840 RepID=A0ABU0H990_9HYPH|nr:(2Fe-2S) ferredoxin domain-containing protein [Kaistia dalseonensis]MCX5496272.1 NAD(P)H-dependent oxidoreductase subunit E [Kaistia dalseonensis]MDQ0438890.1 (2Fe-2S) ferredoxin [Kaistia dalseonensis]
MTISLAEDQPVTPQRVVVLLAKSAFAAQPISEMSRLTKLLQGRPDIERVLFAFSEQGTPSLRDVLEGLRRPEVGEVVILPLLVPMELSFQLWLARTIRRWQRDGADDWPVIHLGAPPALSGAMADLLADMLRSALATPPLSPTARAPKDASVVPAQKRRVLVCQGGACNDAGAATIWGHLRNEQERLKLRTAAGGTMTAKSTCLGPCNLAPVLQVFPEGTYYGGVTEDGIDRIIADHLLRDVVVDALAYAPTGTKQALRA